MSPQAIKIYNEAKACLGKHITLNPTVPDDVNCAESVSFILKNSGVTGFPAGGIAGTASLYTWLANSPKFKRIEAPEQGAIIVSPTGSGLHLVEGHTGICGAFGLQFPNEYGILSNDSDTGLFSEKWNLLTWWEYYGRKGGLVIALFRAL